MRRTIAVIALALTATLFVETAAVAAASTSTTFNMEDYGSYVTYSGKVSSAKPACEKNRKIQVFHNGVLIAETRTDEDGNWSVNGPVPPDGDSVTVKVKKKKRGGKVICRGTSKTETFEED